MFLIGQPSLSDHGRKELIPLQDPRRTWPWSTRYNNRFNPTTKIKYQIPKLSFVNIKVYDVLGSEIAILVNEQKPIGIHTIEFDATNLPSGIYFYQLKANDFTQTNKMILLK